MINRRSLELPSDGRFAGVGAVREQRLRLHLDRAAC